MCLGSQGSYDVLNAGFHTSEDRISILVESLLALRRSNVSASGDVSSKLANYNDSRVRSKQLNGRGLLIPVTMSSARSHPSTKIVQIIARRAGLCDRLAGFDRRRKVRGIDLLGGVLKVTNKKRRYQSYSRTRCVFLNTLAFVRGEEFKCQDDA